LTVDVNAKIPDEARHFDKGEMITILNYVVMQAEVPDLSSQLTLMREFSSDYIQTGLDGSQISQNYCDLEMAVRFLSTISYE
jgi:hypothetical protein